MDSLYGKPYGVNYAPATPLREGIRSYCAHDGVRAVGVSVDVPPICRPSAAHLPPICRPSAAHLPPICRPVQPPLHTPATEGGRGLGRIADRQPVAVQEAGLPDGPLLR